MKKSVLFTIYSLVLTVFVALASCGITALTMENRQIRTGDKIIVSQEEYGLLQRYQKLDTVREWIKNYYYQDVEMDTLVEGAMRGMVSSLEDPYSFYASSEKQESLDQKSAGHYTGIGILSEKKKTESYATIIRVYKDSPAEKAGIQRGDRIVKIDGVELTAEEDITEKILGQPNTEVKLSIQREGVLGEYTLLRQAIVANRIEYEILENDIAYMMIADFEGNVTEEFDEALREMKKNKVKGLILDLRANPGGYVEYACKIADTFLPKGIITYTVTKEGKKENYPSNAYCWDIPLCILVNERTASASEILCGAVQDRGRGIVIGTQTFGKGVVTLTHRFKDDQDAVTLTYADYYTPNGRSIHQKGITPDILCQPDEEEKNNHFLLYKNDPQYKQALAKIKEMIAQKS